LPLMLEVSFPSILHPPQSAQLGQVSQPLLSMLIAVRALLTHAHRPTSRWKLFAALSLTARFCYDTFFSGFIQLLGGH